LGARGGSILEIERSVIAEVLAKTDIVALIGGHVSLRQHGKQYVGLCPFHTERTPSFYVRPERGFFKCFGCGVGGDAIRFIERTERLGFPDAVRVLARRVGVTIGEATEYTSKSRLLRDAVVQANAVAAEFFHRMLCEAASAESARRYCAQRGLDRAAIERFQLGYAPDSWDALRDMLRAAGVEDTVALQAGLLREGTRGVYDFYRNRLMVPTKAITGEVIAFGGRSLGDEEPKYLNTTTTPVYSKGRSLFALSQARRAVASVGSLIVVEGYLDCIALHLAGFEQTVASLGTAFTAEQASLIARYAKNVYLAFDGDRAGRGATLKALEMLTLAGCHSKVIEFPPGQDPDAFLRAHGPDAFRRLLEQARHEAEYRIDERLAALDDGFATPTDRVAAAERIVRDMPRAEWDRWRLYVADRLGLAIDDLRRARIAPPPQRPIPSPTGSVDRPLPPRPPTPAPRPSRDRDILGIFVETPSLLAEYRDRIAPERIRELPFRRLYRCLLAADRLETGVDVLMAARSDELAAEALLALSSEERSPTLRYRDMESRRLTLDRLLALFAREDDEQRRQELGQQIDVYLATGVPVPTELLAEQRDIEARLYRGVARASTPRV